MWNMFSRLKVVLANLNAVRINYRKMWTGLKVVLLFCLHVIFDLRSMLCLTASFLIIILTLCIDTILCSPPKNKTVLTLPPSHPISSGWTSYGTLLAVPAYTPRSVEECCLPWSSQWRDATTLTSGMTEDDDEWDPKGQICITMPNFIELCQKFAELLWFTGFQNDGCLLSWIFKT